MQKIAEPSVSRLTGRERQAISLLASGKTYAQTSKMMKCSVYTVYNHFNNARRNCDVSTTSQLIAVCIRDGEIVKHLEDIFITAEEALGRIKYVYE